MRSFVKFEVITATAALLLASTAGADVVKLTGGRQVRVVAVRTNGNAATLTLTSGGDMTVPASSIESIEAEPVNANLCGASAFRCQDRAMLLTRRAQAKAAANALSTAQHAAPTAQP